MTPAETLQLPPSIAQVLTRRGFVGDSARHFLNPSLDQLASPDAFGDMNTAVQRLLTAVRAEQPVAIYADRDVDGLSGLAILVRTLRSIGGTVSWGSPVKGRGVEREVLERLAASGAKVIVLVDCGTGEHAELEWLASQGIDTIVADHHRFSEVRPTALAWIHPGTLEDKEGAAPAGCVMAFKLAQAIWISFLGTDDPERMDYFLFSHLDLVCLGVLADRMPLRGENRILVWHGLRRLAYSRKVGIGTLTRFFRLTPRSGPLTVREVTWRIIPLLNAGGRLGRPDLTAELLITEDPDVAHACIDELLQLNTQRRAAQDKSVEFFEKAVLEQCAVETDSIIVALSQDLEPSVTGLAAQALARKFGRPAFLFVSQGDHAVGSGRAIGGVDLFAWVETHQEIVVKFGGHAGAVGLTIRTADFAAFRGRLLESGAVALAAAKSGALSSEEGEDISSQPEAQVLLEELSELWWTNLSRLSPFGMGHPLPLFQINAIETIASAKKRRSKFPLKNVILKAVSGELKAEADADALTARGRQSLDAIAAGETAGPWVVVGYPAAVSKSEREFTWKIRDIYKEMRS